MDVISFSSFPRPLHDSNEGAIHYENVEDDISMAVELEDEDFEGGGLKLAYPGEPLTSTQVFMR